MNRLISMAFRNLSRQKRRSFLLGGAIAFGIMIVTIISSLAGGLMGNVAANIAHLFAGHAFAVTCIPIGVAARCFTSRCVPHIMKCLAF
ncbi:MAG: hypothetical protein SNJ56_01790, partial [Termitinemataceae bacterium]